MKGCTHKHTRIDTEIEGAAHAATETLNCSTLDTGLHNVYMYLKSITNVYVYIYIFEREKGRKGRKNNIFV